MDKIAEKTLGQLMRDGWDRRIASDYLSWMNDRVSSNDELWATGERDIEQLFVDLPEAELREQTALELGCGVGRLLKIAEPYFQKLIGVDVSSEAISQAAKLLEQQNNIEPHLCDGMSLNFIPSASLDFVYSFGVLCNMPVIACARNLLEVSRMLKVGGRARLQIFLGRCQPTIAEDTVAYRSFDPNAFAAVAAGIGMELEWTKPLKLPVEVPEDGWLRPEICALRKTGESRLSAEEIEALLVPGGEAHADQNWPGSHVEYQLALLRADELAKAGEPEKALAAVKFAVNSYRDADPKLVKLVKEV